MIIGNKMGSCNIVLECVVRTTAWVNWPAPFFPLPTAWVNWPFGQFTQAVKLWAARKWTQINWVNYFWVNHGGMSIKCNDLLKAIMNNMHLGHWDIFQGEENGARGRVEGRILDFRDVHRAWSKTSRGGHGVWSKFWVLLCVMHMQDRPKLPEVQ